MTLEEMLAIAEAKTGVSTYAKHEVGPRDYQVWTVGPYLQAQDDSDGLPSGVATVYAQGPTPELVLARLDEMMARGKLEKP